MPLLPLSFSLPLLPLPLLLLLPLLALLLLLLLPLLLLLLLLLLPSALGSTFTRLASRPCSVKSCDDAAVDSLAFRSDRAFSCEVNTPPCSIQQITHRGGQKEAQNKPSKGIERRKQRKASKEDMKVPEIGSRSTCCARNFLLSVKSSSRGLGAWLFGLRVCVCVCLCVCVCVCLCVCVCVCRRS
jgi:hypothetical protein